MLTSNQLASVRAEIASLLAVTARHPMSAYREGYEAALNACLQLLEMAADVSLLELRADIRQRLAE